MTIEKSKPANQDRHGPLGQTLSRRLTINWEVIVYIAILIVAIFTRFYILGDRTMSHDESLHTKFSWDLYRQGVYVHTPLMHGPILFHVTALMYALFGDNDFTARIYPAVLGVLMVMFPVLFRRWLGRWGAILASIMILISPLLLYYNRYIREDTPSIFYTMVMVYCTFMYLDGAGRERRRARWLYIFAAAMLASLASKEVAFIYIAVFGSFLTLYWLMRLGQHFFRLPGKTLMYFLSVAVLMAGVVALAMYIVLSIAPLDTALALGPGTQEYVSLLNWTLLVLVMALLILGGTLVWVYRRRVTRIPWLDVLLLLALIVIVCAVFIYIEERSHIQKLQDASLPAEPAVPGQEEVAAVRAGYNPLPIVLMYVASGVLIVGLLYSRQAGWWRTLHRFRELDILLLMGTLILPWLMPFITAFTGVTPAEYTALGQAAPDFVKNLIPTSDPQAIGKTMLAMVAMLPAFALAITAGLVWSSRRWIISAAVFSLLFVFFFTTVFTNMPGLAGMYTSLDYWLEQQAVRRGNQPQYYYLVVIMPFYEFLPILGSVLAMFAGLNHFWQFRKARSEERSRAQLVNALEPAPEPLQPVLDNPDSVSESQAGAVPSPRPVLAAAERLTRVPFLLFVSWWAVLNLIGYTLAGEKMPWLGTHMTLPLIFLAAWYFGRIFDRIDWNTFQSRGWLALTLLPILYVALAQVIGPFVVGPALGGLQQAQLARLYQWIAGIVIAAGVLYALWRLWAVTGWAHLRQMAAVAVFAVLGFITFRSAWMASFINYDLATEFLVYAHGAPANKRVTEQLQELSLRITDGSDLRFAYDFKISWPGAWYFRNFRNAVYLGESPSPRSFDDMVAVIVGDENRATVEAALEDRYFRFDYIRLWWPMQDYFGLTPQRVINALDFSPGNVQAQQIRRGIWDMWWWRDYTAYGEAVGKSFKITEWPVADRMYVFLRKDVAAQVWTLGAGDGSAANPLRETQVNLCTANWQPRLASQIIGSAGVLTGQLNSPRQMAIGLDGRLYVAEEFNHRISVFNADGSFAFAFGQQGAGEGSFERPNGIAVGPSGQIYVADTWNFRVQVFTPDGEFVRAWGQRGEYGLAAQVTPEDAFWGPRAVVVDSEARVYVADTGNKRIRVYDQNGRYLRDIGSGGSGSGQLDEPVGLAISPDGVLYVADTWNRRVSAFLLDGTPANIFINSQDGTTSNSFRVRAWFDDLGNRPYLALDPVRNLLYVTDPDAGRILIYDLSGNCVGSFGQLNREQPDASQFASVGGLAVDEQGNLFAGDAGSGRILRFDPYTSPAQESGALPEMTVEIGSEGRPAIEETSEITPEAVG